MWKCLFLRQWRQPFAHKQPPRPRMFDRPHPLLTLQVNPTLKPAGISLSLSLSNRHTYAYDCRVFLLSFPFLIQQTTCFSIYRSLLYFV